MEKLMMKATQGCLFMYYWWPKTAVVEGELSAKGKNYGQLTAKGCSRTSGVVRSLFRRGEATFPLSTHFPNVFTFSLFHLINFFSFFHFIFSRFSSFPYFDSRSLSYLLFVFSILHLFILNSVPSFYLYTSTLFSFFSLFKSRFRSLTYSLFFFLILFHLIFIYPILPFHFLNRFLITISLPRLMRM